MHKVSQTRRLMWALMSKVSFNYIQEGGSETQQQDESRLRTTEQQL